MSVLVWHLWTRHGRTRVESKLLGAQPPLCDLLSICPVKHHQQARHTSHLWFESKADELLWGTLEAAWDLAPRRAQPEGVQASETEEWRGTARLRGPPCHMCSMSWSKGVHTSHQKLIILPSPTFACIKHKARGRNCSKDCHAQDLDFSASQLQRLSSLILLDLINSAQEKIHFQRGSIAALSREWCSIC